MMMENTADRLEAGTGGNTKAVINLRNIYIRIGNELAWILEGIDWSKMEVGEGQSSGMLQQLALISIFQFAEDLTDQQAVDALRTRMDWKYALQISLTSPGIQPEELCNFRRTLLRHPSLLLEMEKLVEKVTPYGLFGARPQVEGLACRLVGKTCNNSRIHQVESAFDQALGALAACDHQWLKEIACPHWYARYGNRGMKLKTLKGDKDIKKYTLGLGADVRRLLQLVQASTNPQLASLQEINQLEKVLERHYRIQGDNMEWRITCKDGEEYAIYLNNQVDALKL